MFDLNLPAFEYKFSEKDGKRCIFDPFRKKYLVLTPEEWVRQHFANYLINHKSYSKNLISTESGVGGKSINKRADIIAYDRQGKPILLVECKAPQVKITQDVFDQAASYCFHLGVRHLIVTNGLDHFACVLHLEKNEIEFLKDIPEYEKLLTN